MRNTKLELVPKVQKSHLNILILKLKNSGYNQKFRTEVLDSSMKAFQRMVENDKSGVKPLFRSREWLLKRESKIQCKSVLIVTPTPGGSL